jgi:YD repeat-containing protein
VADLLSSHRLYTTGWDANNVDAIEALPGDRPWFLVAEPGDGRMTLAWTGTDRATQGYHVERATAAAGPFTRLTTTPVAETGYTDQAQVVTGTTYYYRVIGVDAVGAATPDWGLGKGWRLNGDQAVTRSTYDQTITWTDGDGSRATFILQNGAYVAESQTFLTLTEEVNGELKIVRKDGVILRFNPLGTLPTSGRLTSITDANGNSITYTLADDGRISTMTPSAGYPWTLEYDQTRHLVKVTDGAGSGAPGSAGRTHTYTYDRGLLTAVTDAMAATTVYGYEGDRLASVTDPGGAKQELGSTLSICSTLGHAVAVPLPMVSALLWGYGPMARSGTGA